jgi:hypothetical protein
VIHLLLCLIVSQSHQVKQQKKKKKNFVVTLTRPILLKLKKTQLTHIFLGNIDDDMI